MTTRSRLPLAPIACLALAGWLAFAGVGTAAPPPHLELLPPETTWDEASRALAVPSDDPWATPFEAGGMVDSPSYDDTVAWLERLAAASPRVRMVSLGKSPERRDIWLVVASLEGAATPAELAANGRPTLLAQGGIHSGEIDGKDAGMMLLRDLTVGGSRAELLERANFLFVPILNVDGHERRSPYGRINQRGPATTGWRTNSRNLNLNRDYAKADTLEMRYLLAALGAWQPDLYLDLHVTDGEDYQYDITFGWNGPHAWSPEIAGWLDATYGPALTAALLTAGHSPGLLTFGIDRLDFARGIAGWTAGPRFSNGYGDARHLPTVLVENHSLKSFDRRVLGTYVLLVESLRVLGEDGGALARAIAADRARRPESLPLAFGMPSDAPPPTVEYRGVRHRLELSEVSGGPVVRWTGEPLDYPALPLYAATEPTVVVTRPRAYLVPPAYREVIERLAAHGIAMETLEEARELQVEMYRLADPELAEEPFEGRVMVTATAVSEVRRERFAPGTVRVPTDQPLGELAMLLLEPASPDSFFQWGFFHEILSRTEYVESYVMEPMARQMLEDDPVLAAEYLAALAADEDLRRDPDARLAWFYERTPYADDRHLLYPVARERSPLPPTPDPEEPPMSESMFDTLPRVPAADTSLPGNLELGAFSISLAVADLAKSRAFYEKLGFVAVGGDGEHYQILKNGETTIGLFHGMFERNILTFNPGLTNRMERLDSFTDVRELESHLDAQGLELATRPEEGSTGAASITLIDPDGNPVLIDQFF